MKSLIRLLAALFLVSLTSCASRTPFYPGGPTTVGMPEKLSDREREFISEIDTALRQQGLTPVKHGKGDLQLDFEISSGPINIDTYITLIEDENEIVSAEGRSGGMPFVGRDGVARKSFDEAFAEFQLGLERIASNRGWSSAPASDQSSPAGPADDPLPVY